MNKIGFTPMKEIHIALILRWLKNPHIDDGWYKELSDSLMHEKLLSYTYSKVIHPYIITFEQDPIGYIHAYDAQHAVSVGWEISQSSGTYGIDLMIGEHAFVNQGHGSEILREFITLFESTHSVHKWITNANLGNLRSMRFYEKMGFKPIEDMATRDGTTIIMMRAGTNKIIDHI